MGALGIGMGLDVGELQAVREAVPNKKRQSPIDRR